MFMYHKKKFCTFSTILAYVWTFCSSSLLTFTEDGSFASTWYKWIIIIFKVILLKWRECFYFCKVKFEFYSYNLADLLTFAQNVKCLPDLCLIHKLGATTRKVWCCVFRYNGIDLLTLSSFLLLYNIWLQTNNSYAKGYNK